MKAGYRRFLEASRDATVTSLMISATVFARMAALQLRK
jgi:hypothetical protein